MTEEIIQRDSKLKRDLIDFVPVAEGVISGLASRTTGMPIFLAPPALDLIPKVPILNPLKEKSKYRGELIKYILGVSTSYIDQLSIFLIDNVPKVMQEAYNFFDKIPEGF